MSRMPVCSSPSSAASSADSSRSAGMPPPPPPPRPPPFERSTIAPIRSALRRPFVPVMPIDSAICWSSASTFPCSSSLVATGTPIPARRRSGERALVCLPVVQEALEAYVGQRVLHERLEDRVRKRRHVGAGFRGIHNVLRRTEARREDVRRVPLHSIDLHDLVEQIDAVVPYVVNTSEERADVGGACLCRKDRLRRREA